MEDAQASAAAAPLFVPNLQGNPSSLCAALFLSLARPVDGQAEPALHRTGSWRR